MPYPSYGISLKDLNITTADTPDDVAAAVTVTDVRSGEDAGPVTNGIWNTGEVTSLNSRFVVFQKPASVATAAAAAEISEEKKYAEEKDDVLRLEF